MKFLQLRINYTENPAHFYQELATPLQQLLATRYFYRWNLSRGWQNGPHYLLTLDASAPFYQPAWGQELLQRTVDFLHTHPSAPLDHTAHLALQTRLNQLEAAGIDPDVIAPNNTATLAETPIEQLATRYESPQQWLSVFTTECRLRQAIVTHRTADGGHSERYAFELMLLLACVYPPAPSDDPEVFEYNGFLSFQSNYVFWHHSLPAVQQEAVTARFAAHHASNEARDAQWLAQLEDALSTPGHASGTLAQLLVQSFLEYCQLARDGVIHQRSPFPRARLAERQQVSAFHQHYFYTEEGTAKAFDLDFCAYRWLLNIVYRVLPLLNVSPLVRQQLNYSLNRLQQEHAPAIRRIRAAMLCIGMPSHPIMKAAA